MKQQQGVWVGGTRRKQQQQQHVNTERLTKKAMELFADRRKTLRARDVQEVLSRRNMLLRKTFVHGDARNPENSPGLSGTERAEHTTKKVIIDTGFDTDTSTSTDETTTDSGSSGGDGGYIGVVADVARRSTSATSAPPTRGRRHVYPPPSPRSPPPSYEAALLHSRKESTFSSAKGERPKSATLPTSRGASAGGKENLKVVAAAVTAASARRWSSRSFSPQDGERGSRVVEVSELMPIDDDIAAGAGLDGGGAGKGGWVNGRSGDLAIQDGRRNVKQLQASRPTSSRSYGSGGGEAVRRDGSEKLGGGERGRGGHARERGEVSGPAGVRGVIWGQPSLRPSRGGTNRAPHHRRTWSTPEAQVAEECGVRVLEEAGGTQHPSAKGFRAEQATRSLSLQRTRAPKFFPDVLDVEDRPPAQHEKESASPQRHQGRVEASGGGRGGGKPGVPLPPPPLPVEVALFSPVTLNPSANALWQGRNPSAVSERGDLFFSKKGERLGREQATVSVAAGAAAGARAGGDDGGVGAVEPSPEEEEVLSAGEESSLSSSSVWVTGCSKCSGTHNLVYMLSDGSVGMHFKDNTKMVVDPTADTFECTDPPPSSSSRTTAAAPSPSSSPLSYEPRPGTGRHVRGGTGDEPEDSYSSMPTSTHRYSLDYFPFYLRKRLSVLRSFRERVLLSSGCRRRENGSESAAAAVTQDRAPLTFIERWQSVGGAMCLQLSNQTMQVLFIDGTSILLSKDCRLVTVLDTGRETRQRLKTEDHSVCCGFRKERVRQAKSIVVNFLEGSQASEGGRPLTDAP